MEIKVKPKAVESTTMMATKEEDEIKKKMKDCVVIGQEADEEVSKGQGETRQVDSKLETDKNFSSQKTKKEEENKKEENNNYISNMKHKKTSSHVWDCGSTLYDSFELNSFKRQLDSAISTSSARTMSMSRLPDRRLPPLSSLSPENPPRLPPLPTTSSSSSSGGKKHSNKISRSLQRFLKKLRDRFVLKLKNM
ncbi:PREDICTED: uncharacterized protein LOC104720705 [Camelina sativa]|uniref:Uncharacterized protein LOC104720705 n=1 Tax=Camelina sativa TaxID=90675 RepID=A0ABM0U6X7_CAMSA|nr:PREDICTED: uncharacterized protein LOC104720705 [Camelina sativa]